MNEETLKVIIENIHNIRSIIIVVGVLTVVNFISMLGKIFIDIRLGKKKEIHVNRKTEILKKEIQVCEELFSMLEHLTLYDNHNLNTYLRQIQLAERFISTHKLYVCKPIIKTSTKLLDYYKIVANDFRKKDIAIEKNLIDEYIKLFNK